MTDPVFLAPVPLLAGAAPGATVTLTGDEARHAVVVRRLGPGDRIALVDGCGTRAVGAIVAVAGPAQLAVALEAVRREAEPPLRLTVVLALIKGPRLEGAVEMLTELGAHEIVPWQASRSIVRISDARAERVAARLQHTVVAAAKQSRRARFPVLAPVAGTASVRQRIAAASLAVVLHENATQPLDALAVPRSGEVIVVVGPEGGIAPAEVDAFADDGALLVRLGTGVLRTATAAVAGAAVLLARGGQWRQPAAQ